MLLVLASGVVGSGTGNKLMGELWLVVRLLELLHGLSLIGVWRAKVVSDAERFDDEAALETDRRRTNP